jgi:hypothetical protein
VGIIYYEGGPTIVEVFTNENRDSFVELEETRTWDGILI